jgi:hypothetical protein
MNPIKLNKRQFEYFNDCDSNFIFKEEMDKVVNAISEEERNNFNYEQFIAQKTKELFKTYDHIIVTKDDKIYGVNGSDVVFIKETESAFECAQQVK